MRNWWKLLAWLLVVGLTTAGVYRPVLAEESTETAGTTETTESAGTSDTLDTSKKCSICLIIDSEGKAAGGTFSAYKLAALEEVDGEYVFKDIHGDRTIDLKDDKSIAEYLEYYKTYVTDNADTVQAAATASANAGQVKFEDLEPGVYLFRETGVISGYTTMADCLFSVPGWEKEKGFIYNREAVTKPQIKPNPEEGSTTTTEETPTDDDTYSESDDDDTDYSESSDSDSDSSSSKKLPQTGQLWWPLPLLLCAGLVLMLAGRKIRK